MTPADARIAATLPKLRALLSRGQGADYYDPGAALHMLVIAETPERWRVLLETNGHCFYERAADPQALLANLESFLRYAYAETARWRATEGRPN